MAARGIAGPLAGRWALVTGASSGIGAAFADELAQRGVHLVLVARSVERLRVRAEVCRAAGVQARPFACDLGQAGAAAAVAAWVHGQGLRIDLLINNAGADPWGAFESRPADTCEHLLHLLAATPMGLCRAFHADLAAGPGAVINVSSPAAYQPMPWKAAYAAGKAALHSFSLALRGEWGEQGILVQTLVPGPTASGIEVAGNAYDCPLRRGPRDAPERVVCLSLDRLASGDAVVATAKRLWLQRLFAACAPIDHLLRTVGGLARPAAPAR